MKKINTDIKKRIHKDISEELAEKTFRELETGKYGKLRENTGGKPLGNPLKSPKFPFRIPVIEKTIRQATSTQGYKASAYCLPAEKRSASRLRIVVKRRAVSLGGANVFEDAARSMVATIEEGWARPSTKEYLDYLGFSQASLTEVRGDIERLQTDGYLKSGSYGRISTPSRNFPYPPINSRKFPIKYGKLRERLLEYTGREIRPRDLTYEIFIEFINKTDYLIKNAIFGLQGKIVKDEKTKLREKLEIHVRKYG